MFFITWGYCLFLILLYISLAIVEIKDRMRSAKKYIFIGYLLKILRQMHYCFNKIKAAILMNSFLIKIQYIFLHTQKKIKYFVFKSGFYS